MDHWIGMVDAIFLLVPASGGPMLTMRYRAPPWEGIAAACIAAACVGLRTATGCVEGWDVGAAKFGVNSRAPTFIVRGGGAECAAP